MDLGSTFQIAVFRVGKKNLDIRWPVAILDTIRYSRYVSVILTGATE
jgi:hypothetical protein